MVPNVAKTGTSFKGALAYYLHDKREEGEEIRTTNERVAWTETRNLATDNPDLAGRIMAATAMDQDRLKAEAGVAKTGRKSNGESVYAYSIAWHPEEAGKLTRAEMVRAANESIVAIGAQDRQALLVCHRDEPQPHVHVIVNRVSPEDGRMLSKHQDFKKLDAWALAYRQGRGEEHKYCPVRQEKADAAKRSAAGEEVDYVRSEKSTPRGLFEENAKAIEAGALNAKQVTAAQRELNAALGKKTRAMNDRHSQEWKDLSAGYQQRKSEIFTGTKEAIAKARTGIKEQYRPAWRQLLRQQDDQKHLFNEREERVIGKIHNAIEAVVHARRLDPDSSRGFLGNAYNYAMNHEARAGALDKLHRMQRRELGATHKATLGAAINKIRQDQGKQLAENRQGFQSQRAGLKDRQGADKTQMKSAWRRRNEERDRAYSAVRANAESRTGAKAGLKSETARKAAEKAPEGFKKASKENAPEKAKSAGRKRSRVRKRDGGGGSTGGGKGGEP